MPLVSLSSCQGEYLAQQLAQQLQDTKSIAFYRSLVKKYPPSFLLSTLSYVLEVPPERIHKSRARYFTHMIKVKAKQDVVPENLPIVPEREAPQA